MHTLKTMVFEVTDRVARITLNRPSRGNGSGFFGGYDLVESAQAEGNIGELNADRPLGSTLDPMVQMQNHIPNEVWDPMLDYAMMSRNVKGFMSLFHSEKPVVCKVHGYCVAGGTDMALCSNLLVIAEDAKIGRSIRSIGAANCENAGEPIDHDEVIVESIGDAARASHHPNARYGF